MKWQITEQGASDYDAAYEQRTAMGIDVHGEVAFVQRFQPRSVLDAGCGTGRVARELAHRGIDVVGVDVDPAMLATAQRKDPALDWRLADLETFAANRTFDAIVMAGNVMIFVAPGTEGAVVANLARHLTTQGVLIAGFALNCGLTLARYDALAQAVGLQLAERWATWERGAWHPDSDYAVSVHSRSPSTMPEA